MLLERRARLRLARHRPAEAHGDLVAAAANWRRLGVQHHGLAAWRVDDCPALRRAGQRAAARAPLTRALDVAEHGGMRLLATRARAELIATGARPRRSAASGVDALTPAERRVAILAAGGCDNREIAQQLFVTRRTVETYLTHPFQKLGVSTRTELAQVMGAASQ